MATKTTLTDKTNSLRNLCMNAGWTAYAFAKHVGINHLTAQRALKGKAVKPPIAKKIADTFSELTGEIIRVSDITDLNVLYLREQQHPLS